MRINPRRGLLEMLAVKCRPSLFLDQRQSVAIVGNTPAMSVWQTGLILPILPHQRVL